jgi:hypothetical protein
MERYIGTPSAIDDWDYNRHGIFKNYYSDETLENLFHSGY